MPQDKFTERVFVNALEETLESCDYFAGTAYVDEGPQDLETDIVSISDFETAGVLSGNAGLVVSLGDGTEFQVTVVQSR